jgi:hypothetical protein
MSLENQDEKGFVERCLEDIENNPDLYDALGGDTERFEVDHDEHKLLPESYSSSSK